ncbi:MAG TPA: DUF3348 domain-containing protein [Accumulibacter sp.]|nr:DUF3348 domain-containing protein [Accumulibacter sp.]
MTNPGMTPALPRTSFNSSPLVRLLGDLLVVDTAESTPDFAERLGEWLNVSDAIALHATHHFRATSRPSTAVDVAVEEQFKRVRATLADSIVASCSPNAGETRLKLPAPTSDASSAGLDAVAAYGPYRRFYLAHQGDMEGRIRPLRIRVREALASASASLGRLAALDEALDKVLYARERQLLSMVPSLLERRFERLLETHRRTMADTPEADTPSSWTRSGGWLATFQKELQDVLLAELDLRLQPTAGLIDALGTR